MNLYKVNLTTVFPGNSESEALYRFQDETEPGNIQESDFSIVVPKDDYDKIFKFAIKLYEVNAVTEINVAEITSAYAKKLGYELSDDDIWEGILKWVERVCDLDEDEIDEWLK